MISVIVTGPSADPQDVTEPVTARAAELALGSLRDIWPVRTGRSRDGLHATADSVEGTASYTDDVHARGSSVPIADGQARTIGEQSADAAVSETDAEVSREIDGILTDILRTNMER